MIRLAPYGRREVKESFLLFDNMASREAVWGMANSPTDISTFSNEKLIPKLAIFFSARICYNIAS